MAQENGLSLKRAIGISAALHLLFVPLLFVVQTFVGSGGVEPVGGVALDRSSVVTTLTIEHRPKAAPARVPLRVAQLPVERLTTHEKRRPIAPPRVVHDAPVVGVPAVRVAHVARPRAAQGEEGPAEPNPARPAARPASVASDLDASTPGPAPSAAATVAAVAVALSEKTTPERGSEASAGGWGQNFDNPMLPDETTLADLKAKYHVAGITIKVDESGRALRVIVPASLPEEARDEIVQRLSAVHYVPAECNGLRCAGTLVVSL
jgi:hypothetical protein